MGLFILMRGALGVAGACGMGWGFVAAFELAGRFGKQNVVVIDVPAGTGVDGKVAKQGGPIGGAVQLVERDPQGGLGFLLQNGGVFAAAGGQPQAVADALGVQAFQSDEVAEDAGRRILAPERREQWGNSPRDGTVTRVRPMRR